MSSTINLAATMNWALPFLSFKPVNQGINNEPAISCANTVLQTILGPPFSWRWNRNNVTYNVIQAQLDFPSAANLAASWIANHSYALNAVIVDSNGNVQQVTTAGTSGTPSHPTWSTTVMGTTTDNTVTWTMVNPTDFGFIEKASVNQFEMKVENILGTGTEQARPGNIATQGDNGSGIITFRTYPSPDATYPITVTYQKKANLFQSLASTWSPVPDEFSYIYNWGFLALSTAYSDDPKFPIYNSKFMSSLLGASEGLDELQKSIFVGNWLDMMGQSVSRQLKTQAGAKARET